MFGETGHTFSCQTSAVPFPAKHLKPVRYHIIALNRLPDYCLLLIARSAVWQFNLLVKTSESTKRTTLVPHIYLFMWRSVFCPLLPFSNWKKLEQKSINIIKNTEDLLIFIKAECLFHTDIYMQTYIQKLFAFIFWSQYFRNKNAWNALREHCWKESKTTLSSDFFILS